MKKHLTFACTFLALTGAASAQNLTRRASITNRASGDREKCTIEVVVDGAAEVEIRGDTATLRNLSGQPPQWRRFECSAPMPPDPANFRFQGVDGRGRQELIRDARGGSPAVIRIEDPDNGSEGYTFDITWTNGNFRSGPAAPVPPPPPAYERGGYGRFTTEQAVEVCRESVRQQAMDRFRTQDINFRRINIDNSPGRNDWVIGVMDVRFGGREEAYRFSCSVDFESGRVRSADIQRFEGEREWDRGPRAAAPGIQSCQSAVEERLRRNGFDRVVVHDIRADDRPGGADRVTGSAEADGRNRRPETYEFSCTVNLERGDVSAVDLNRRY